MQGTDLTNPLNLLKVDKTIFRNTSEREWSLCCFKFIAMNMYTFQLPTNKESTKGSILIYILLHTNMI